MNDPAPPRVPFYDEVNSRSIDFAKQLLTFVPELDGLAIVPSWKIQQDRLPLGVIRGREGALSNPLSLMLMLEQLLAVLRHESRTLEQLLQVYDQKAQQTANELKSLYERHAAKTAELVALDAQIADRRRALAQQ